MKEGLLIAIIIIQVIMANGVKGDLDRNFKQTQSLAMVCHASSSSHVFYLSSISHLLFIHSY
tara:strand:+ start:758 stop:943 length:186 start_codon:yes stop_codon:yes gene_type:complete